MENLHKFFHLSTWSGKPTCGQESLRRNEVAIIVNKRVRNAVRGCNLKNDRMISVCFWSKPFNITVIQVWDWNAKVGSQETPGVAGKFGLGIQNEAGQRLIEFCQENALIIANTLFQQHKRRCYTWTTPDGQHLNQIDYIICSQRCRSSKQSAKNKMGSWLWLRFLLPNSDLNWR